MSFRWFTFTVTIVITGLISTMSIFYSLHLLFPFKSLPLSLPSLVFIENFVWFHFISYTSITLPLNYLVLVLKFTLYTFSYSKTSSSNSMQLHVYSSHFVTKYSQFCLFLMILLSFYLSVHYSEPIHHLYYFEHLSFRSL